LIHPKARTKRRISGRLAVSEATQMQIMESPSGLRIKRKSFFWAEKGGFTLVG